MLAALFAKFRRKPRPPRPPAGWIPLVEAAERSGISTFDLVRLTNMGLISGCNYGAVGFIDAVALEELLARRGPTFVHADPLIARHNIRFLNL